MDNLINMDDLVPLFEETSIWQTEHDFFNWLQREMDHDGSTIDTNETETVSLRVLVRRHWVIQFMQNDYKILQVGS